jgi:hypothetical protein
MSEKDQGNKATKRRNEAREWESNSIHIILLNEYSIHTCFKNSNILTRTTQKRSKVVKFNTDLSLCNAYRLYFGKVL